MEIKEDLLVVEVTSLHELAYVVSWCEQTEMEVHPLIRNADVFPIRLDISGSFICWADPLKRTPKTEVTFMQFVEAVG